MINYDEFKSHVLHEFPKEACGYIINDIFYPVDNVHPDPVNNFLFPENISFNLTQYDDYIIIHSHTHNILDHDPRIPSIEDMESQINTGKEWWLYHTDGEVISEPLKFGPPNKEDLLNRDYIPNIFDCITIARDYFYKELNIDIGLHPRPVKWEEWNPSYIEDTYAKIGFKKINENIGLLKGDVVLFAIGSRFPNHIGIMLDDKRFIHHLYNRKSSTDILSKWHRQVKKVLRYGR